MDHAQAPVLDALAAYHRAGRYAFTPPGHKQGRGADPRVRAVLGADTFRADVLATSGLDDRQTSGGFVAEAEELMAHAVGAEHAFFSTCGSSLSVKAAMLAVAGGRGELLVGRDAHKSVISGLILSGLRPRWVRPRWDGELHLAHPPSAAEVEACWERWPDAAGMLVTSPTPYGTCADLATIAEVCHQRGRPLIVDEAWGAHLPFHEDLPTWAMDAGADVCVVSVHKMGAGFEQGSVFHLQGDLVDPARLRACADLLATTSPNVLLYAAMDGWRRQMVEQGHGLLQSALDLAGDLRLAIDGLDGLRVMQDEFLGVEASHDLDRLQIVVDTAGLGISGYQAADWLREHAHLDMGMSDHRRISAQLTFADDSHTGQRLVTALQGLVDAAPALPSPTPVELPDPTALELETIALPRDAFFGPTEAVPPRGAVGRIAAEQLTPYPPGIPVALPGERINAAVVQYLLTGREAGMAIPDAADPDLATIRVART
ncbi:aminotransferase class I/II-fold pyridoxal phosphate-dependent enzyme [Parafrankia elaeagni]|uniref:aminotransferase class I/II-fold pyridoxal phosphate-dependent enzyme n=1 Tax=Parafrankia elaeagni TaxID=222534 RepID=UPI00037E8F66|nr:hypothetical protein [Parafrankia elaeagni]